MTGRLKSLLLAAALGLGVAGPAAAAQPKTLGTFQDWSAFKIQSDGQTICFIASEPKEQHLSKKGAKRDPVYFLITHWVDRKIKGEPSVVIGYPQKDGSKTTVEIGSSKFEMFTQEDGAWFADPQTEAKVVNAMKRGVKMSVRGVSERGTRTRDVYSLRGISAALDKINAECK